MGQQALVLQTGPQVIFLECRITNTNYSRKGLQSQIHMIEQHVQVSRAGPQDLDPYAGSTRP
jgi:hypothetical protein